MNVCHQRTCHIWFRIWDSVGSGYYLHTVWPIYEGYFSVRIHKKRERWKINVFLLHGCDKSGFVFDQSKILVDFEDNGFLGWLKFYVGTQKLVNTHISILVNVSYKWKCIGKNIQFLQVPLSKWRCLFRWLTPKSCDSPVAMGGGSMSQVAPPEFFCCFTFTWKFHFWRGKIFLIIVSH